MNTFLGPDLLFCAILLQLTSTCSGFLLNVLQCQNIVSTNNGQNYNTEQQKCENEKNKIYKYTYNAELRYVQSPY